MKMETTQKLIRKNVKDSWFLLYLEDDDDFEAGVYLCTKKDDKKPVQYKLISSVIYIKNRIESVNYLSENSKNMYQVVVFDRNKENKYLVQAKDLFDLSYTENDFYKNASNNGLIVWENKRLLVEYLKLQEELADTIKGVENIGWSNGEYYVSGFTTDNAGAVFTGSSKNGFKRNGTKEEQYTFLQNVIAEYPLVYFVFAYTQGGFFNQFLNEDHNQVLEVVGESSRGKSTVGKLCMSSYTNPADFASFNMTKLSIAETMKYYMDSFIYFDEIGEMKIKEDDRSDLLYTLANGMTKARVKKLNNEGDFTTEKQKRLYYSLLLGGEVSILKNTKKTGGLEARLCQIVLDKDTHLFENVTSEFIEDFNLQIAKNYGWLAPDLINAIKNSKDTLHEQYKANLDYVRERYQINSVIENRKIKILAYTLLSASYIASIIFNEEDKEKSAILIETMLDQAYKAIFSNVSYSVGEEDPFKEVLSSLPLTHTHNFIIRSGLSMTESDHPIKDFYGYITKDNNHLEIQVVSTKIDQFCNSILLDKDRLLSYVKENGFAITDMEKGRARKTKKIKGVNYYYFKIPLSFFEYKKELQEPINEDSEDDYVPDFDGAVKPDIALN
jgi:hypothetical protein